MRRFFAWFEKPVEPSFDTRLALTIADLTAKWSHALTIATSEAYQKGHHDGEAKAAVEAEAEWRQAVVNARDSAMAYGEFLGRRALAEELSIAHGEKAMTAAELATLSIRQAH